MKITKLNLERWESSFFQIVYANYSDVIRKNSNVFDRFALSEQLEDAVHTTIIISIAAPIRLDFYEQLRFHGDVD